MERIITGNPSLVLKAHVNKYAIIGLLISICSILFATIAVSYQMTGTISVSGIIAAQMSNPGIWFLDITPFIFAYWGQSFCYRLADHAISIIENEKKAFMNKSGEMESKLLYETSYDHLTRLPNLNFLTQRIEQGIKQLKKTESLVIIILSINDFKDIHYNFSRAVSDNLLIQFTEKLRGILLEPYMFQPNMGMSIVGRLREDEFAFFIPKITPNCDLEYILTNIIETTSTGYEVDGNKMIIKTTAGAAIYPSHCSTADELIQKALLALANAEKEQKSFGIFNQSLCSSSS